jgi:hypothetical protein
MARKRQAEKKAAIPRAKITPAVLRQPTSQKGPAKNMLERRAARPKLRRGSEDSTLRRPDSPLGSALSRVGLLREHRPDAAAPRRIVESSSSLTEKPARVSSGRTAAGAAKAGSPISGDTMHAGLPLSMREAPPSLISSAALGDKIG